MKMRKMPLFLLISLFFCAMAAGASADGQTGTDGADVPAVEWSYTFNRGEGHFVEQTRDGGLILTGWTDSGGAGADVFLAKYDSGRRSLWLQTYQGYGYATAIESGRFSGGGFILPIGETKSKDAYDHDVLWCGWRQRVLFGEKYSAGRAATTPWSVRQTKDAASSWRRDGSTARAYMPRLPGQAGFLRHLIWEKNIRRGGFPTAATPLQTAR